MLTQDVPALRRVAIGRRTDGPRRAACDAAQRGDVDAVAHASASREIAIVSARDIERTRRAHIHSTTPATRPAALPTQHQKVKPVLGVGEQPPGMGGGWVGTDDDFSSRRRLRR